MCRNISSLDINYMEANDTNIEGSNDTNIEGYQHEFRSLYVF